MTLIKTQTIHNDRKNDSIAFKIYQTEQDLPNKKDKRYEKMDDSMDINDWDMRFKHCPNSE